MPPKFLRVCAALFFIFSSISFSADSESDSVIEMGRSSQHIQQTQEDPQEGILCSLWRAKESFRNFICCHSEDTQWDERTALLGSNPTPEHYHWGLYHWGLGIKEYFEGCLCCGTTVPDDAANIWVDVEGNQLNASDCNCCTASPACHNPILGTILCPFAAITHLLWLPWALCDQEAPTREDRTHIMRPVEEYNFSSPPFRKRLPGTFG